MTTKNESAGPDDFGGSDEDSHYCSQARVTRCAACAHSPGFRCVEHRYPNWLPAPTRETRTLLDWSEKVTSEIEERAGRQHAPSPDYSIYEIELPGPLSREAVGRASESRIAYGIEGDADDWYQAMRWRLAQQAPA